MKLLITDDATLKSNNDISTERFKKYGECIICDNISREDLLKTVKDVNVILCNKTVIDREIMEAAPSLKYIGIFATGYNNIDLVCAKEKGITVCNIGGYSTNAVAQQVMGYILMHYTRIPEYNEFVHSGGWQNSNIFSPLVFTSDEIAGKTLGIIGFGSIGKAVKKAAEGFGMNVIVNTRTIRPDGETEFADLDTLLKTSDIVTVHCPLTEQSADMMNSEAFGKMKDGAFFINTSRGGTVDEQALFDALESGKLSGAAVDVLKTEPMSKDCVLMKAKNIIITPHSAWAPYTTRLRLLDLVEEKLQKFINGEDVENLAE